MAPQVFLSYASEDRAQAKRLAEDLTALGIEVFFADWEIRPGDSIRASIDRGLENCTHFLVLLTTNSITKPWVNTEIDAAFVRKVQQRCRFIPVRLGLPASSLSPLLGSLNSPSLDNYEEDLRVLAGHILGISSKPELGSIPDFAKPTLPASSGLSPGARKIVEVFVRDSERGLRGDPDLSPAELGTRTGLTQQELIIAADELERQGLIDIKRAAFSNPLGAGVLPVARLFSRFDGMLMAWRPEEDALAIVAAMDNSGRTTAQVESLAGELKWPVRRINPAVAYLIERDMVTCSKELQAVYVTVQIWIKPNALGWLRSK